MFEFLSKKIAIAVHDLRKLLSEAIRGQLLRVGCTQLVGKRFGLKSIIVLNAGQWGEARSTAAIVELVC